MSYPRIATFARLANGSVAPKRSIAGQASLLNRGMHDVQYDAAHDEIVMANPFAQAILTYRGGADGEEPPIRIIQGPSTQMAHPDYGVAVDAVNNEIFVSEKDYILVFSRTANGDAAPLRVIKGPDSKVNGVRALAVDTQRNLLVAAGRGSILIFDRTANGNAQPKAVIAGPKTSLGRGAIAQLQLAQPKGWIIAGSGGGDEGEGGNINIWSINDDGDVPPVWILGGPQTAIPGPRIALNPKNKELYVGRGLVVKAYSFPEIF